MKEKERVSEIYPLKSNLIEIVVNSVPELRFREQSNWPPCVHVKFGGLGI